MKKDLTVGRITFSGETFKDKPILPPGKKTPYEWPVKRVEAPACPIDMNLVKYCAEEVARQKAGPLAVYWMLEAWQQAKSDFNAAGFENGHRVVAPEWIQKWGSMVERCQPGWRQVPICVGATLVPLHHSHVPHAISNLCEAIARGLSADEAYKQFEEIHPFVDGNGRTGKILYNYILESLDDPKMPPNFWGCANP